MRGAFITFEGGEGSGKSTQARILAETLRDAGVTVTLVREPGGTGVGEAVRALLLDPEHAGLDPRAELLLYEAARAQLVGEVILPALESGSVVFSDRFTDSSTAYQGYARGLGVEFVTGLNAAATGGLMPDRTLLYDLGAATGLARATARGADRIESEDLAFHERVRAGFLAIAAAEPHRVRVIDASGSVEEVAALTRAALVDIPALAQGAGRRP